MAAVGNPNNPLVPDMTVYQSLQWWFEQWWWGYTIVPFTLAIMTGMIAANIVTYREIQRRAHDEMHFLRRRVFPKSSNHDSWEGVKASYRYEMDLIIADFRRRGFHANAENLERQMQTISDAMGLCYQRADLYAHSGDGPMHNAGTAYAFDREVRSQLKRYLDKNLDGFAAEILRDKPDWGGTMDTPTFRRWLGSVRCSRRITPTSV